MQGKRKFDLQAALSGAKLITRDGREVREFAQENDRYLKAMVKMGKTDSLPFYFYLDGTVNIANRDLDLFLAAEPAAPKTRTMWVNVYRDGTRRIERPIHNLK